LKRKGRKGKEKEEKEKGKERRKEGKKERSKPVHPEPDWKFLNSDSHWSQWSPCVFPKQTEQIPVVFPQVVDNPLQLQALISISKSKSKSKSKWKGRIYLFIFENGRKRKIGK